MPPDPLSSATELHRTTNFLGQSLIGFSLQEQQKQKVNQKQQQTCNSNKETMEIIHWKTASKQAPMTCNSFLIQHTDLLSSSSP